MKLVIKRGREVLFSQDDLSPEDIRDQVYVYALAHVCENLEYLITDGK
jgi:hypothetical protein